MSGHAETRPSTGRIPPFMGRLRDVDAARATAASSPSSTRVRRAADVVVVLVAWVFDLSLAPLWATDGGFGGSLVSRLSGEIVPVPLVVAVVSLMALALLLRRRFRLTVYVVVLALSVGMVAWLTYAQPLATLLVATYAAASRGANPRGLAVLGGTIAHVVLISVVVASSYANPTTADLVIPLVFFSVLTVMVWSFARLDAAAFDRSQAFTQQLDARAEEATHEERHRIARELHDILAHSVSAMMMQAAGARAMAGSFGRDHPDDPRLRSVEEALATIETTGSQSMRELHRLLGALRHDQASSLDLDVDLSASAQPGLADLDDLIETPRRSGLIVEIHRSGERGTLDPSVGFAAYRVVQEALTNALKHAGRGAVVDVYEAWQEREVTVQVRCRGSRDATRPQTPNGGTGLRGLQERVELAGGRFEAGWVGDEFVTTAALPTLPRQDGSRS